MGKLSARTRLLVVALVAVAFVVALALIAAFMPFDPNKTKLSAALKSPGTDGFLLGSDSVGRDVLLRTLAGGSESVFAAFAVVAIVFVVGSGVGVASGFLGGAVDAVLSKVVTMFQAFPSFVLAIAVAGVLGQGMGNMVFAIAVVYWTQFARLARSLTLSAKQSDYVRAARVCGAGPGSIMVKYVLPNIVSPLAVLAALSVSDVILTMAGLSFLGLGPARPTNEWGAMMSEAQMTFQYAPWCIIVPAVALFIAVIIFNLLADALRDALDIHARQEVEDVSDRRFLKFKGQGKKEGIEHEIQETP